MHTKLNALNTYGLRVWLQGDEAHVRVWDTTGMGWSAPCLSFLAPVRLTLDDERDARAFYRWDVGLKKWVLADWVEAFRQWAVGAGVL